MVTATADDDTKPVNVDVHASGGAILICTQDGGKRLYVSITTWLVFEQANFVSFSKSHIRVASLVLALVSPVLKAML